MSMDNKNSIGEDLGQCVKAIQMKYTLLTLLIGGAIALSFLIGTYFYQRNVSAMRVEAESLFVHTLTSELQKRKEMLSLPNFSSRENPDTIPLVVYITTEEGRRMYKVDAVKSRKNISRNSGERFLHSVVCEKSPLPPDTLSGLWSEVLHAHKIRAKAAVRIVATDLHGKTSTFRSLGGSESASSTFCAVSYVGSRCEIEVIGFLEYLWTGVYLYDWLPFLWLAIGDVLIIFLSCSFYKLMRRPAKIQVVEVPYPVVVEKEVPLKIYVKEMNQVDAYQLRPGLLLDNREQILLLDGKRIGLASQSYHVLKLFWDAPDHTLTDDEILDGVWAKKGAATIKDFTVANNRLRKALGKVGFFIDFRRVDGYKYRMIVRDNQ